jgi:hypothetical protein
MAEWGLILITVVHERVLPMLDGRGNVESAKS